MKSVLKKVNGKTGILGEILMELRLSYQTSGTDISDQNTLNPQEEL